MVGKHRLSSAFIKTAPVGKHCDGDGLWLFKRPDRGAQWILRVTVHGRRREMGLGSPPDIGLKKARELSDQWRGMAKTGVDPIKERQRQAREMERADNTLRKIAHEAFEARKAELKDDGKAGRWFSPLQLHVLPKLGRVPVEEIDQRDIRDVLAPIWHTKAETAKKAMDRLGIVLKHAAALDLDVDMQATLKAKALLGKSRHQVTHIPALPWTEVPEFYNSLAEPTLTHLALRLLILTGLRSKPVRFLRTDQIDGNVWTIPAEVMKGRRGQTTDFRVPLSGEAQNVIEQALPFQRDGFLFPSVRTGVISDATMSRFMERKGMTERPHGFRSSLRVWLAEATDTPHEIAEMMLAHVAGTSVERAYRRTDYLDRRRILLESWARYVTNGSDRVVSMVAI